VDKEEAQQRERIVVDEFEGIVPMYVAFYIEAIAYAAGRADAAFDRYVGEVGREGPDAEVVAAAHEALGHTAALSRFFFPADRRPLARARAAKLRSIFAVAEGSPLEDRALRNALEHFDERLDAYLLADIVGYVLPSPMVDSAGLADEPVGHIFRLVDPQADIFVLLGERHAFGAARGEVGRIAEAARRLR
jgi:hypothetical protein